jgi:hypothetical protein
MIDGSSGGSKEERSGSGNNLTEVRKNPSFLMLSTVTVSKLRELSCILFCHTFEVPIVDGSSKRDAFSNGAKAVVNGGRATMGVDVRAVTSTGAGEVMMGAGANNSMAGGGVRSVDVIAKGPALLLVNHRGG